MTIQWGQFEQIRCGITLGNSIATLKAFTPFVDTVVEGYKKVLCGTILIVWPSNTQCKFRIETFSSQYGISGGIFLLFRVMQLGYNQQKSTKVPVIKSRLHKLTCRKIKEILPK